MAKKKIKMPVESCVQARPSRDDEARERKYRAEDALRTVNEYNKVKADKALMGDVKRLAKEQIKNLSKVTSK